jgi:hypothetical protein
VSAAWGIVIDAIRELSVRLSPYIKSFIAFIANKPPGTKKKQEKLYKCTPRDSISMIGFTARTNRFF